MLVNCMDIGILMTLVDKLYLSVTKLDIGDILMVFEK